MSKSFSSWISMVALCMAGLACGGGGGSSSSDVAATPAFDPPAGTYDAAQAVAISSATAGATIHYTTDGTTPTAASPVYATPIAVAVNTTIKAIAFAAGHSDSAVATATYVIALPATATPTFDPPAGTYASVQSVTLSCATAGATIYYTTDGGTPTASSTVYSGPISVGANMTVRAIAIAPGHSSSGVGAAAYTIDLSQAATPTFNPPGGTYAAAQSVTITSATPAATLYYTTDGSTPTTASTVYTAPVTVSASGTLKAIAIAAGLSASGVGTASYAIELPAATPTFDPPAGTYTTIQSVTLSSTTAGAVIHYTTDGSAPTASSPTYGAPITVAATTTIRALALAAGSSPSAVGVAAYSIDLIPAATPTFTPTGGTYGAAQAVTISSATAGATLYYTTDGSTPTTSSTVYRGAVAVGASATLRAIAVAPGFSTSGVGTADYVINLPAGTPTFSPPAGTYTTIQSVTLSSTTAGAVIHYTTDGSAPTASSPTYGAPITVAATTTIRAVAIAADHSASGVGVAAYTINLLPAATPTFNPVAGTYTSAQSVTISSATPGATIHCTTDGSPATAASPTCGAAIPVSADMTIRAVASAIGYTTSAEGTADYLIQPPAATPTFAPIAGTYTSAQSVTISSTTSSATIYYTTDGTTPTTASTVYAGPVAISANRTLKAIATAAGFSASAIGTAAYTINLPAATPTFSPPAGTYSSAQSVTISSATPSATIYYTTDGTTPTTASTVYAGPVTISANRTLKAIATAAGFSTSAVGTAAYSILPAAAAPTFDPPAGEYRGTQVTLATTSSGATIYYTTDGSTPTTSSAVYSTPISIQDGHADITIQAIASGGAWSASSVSSATYTSRVLERFPFPTVGCYPSGTAMGTHGEPLYVTRSSSATYLDAGGGLHTCSANQLRVGCDSGYSGHCGLLVEPAATQLYPTPSAPAAGSVTLHATGWYQFSVYGSGSQAISAPGTLVANGLCTATEGHPCNIEVTTLGDGVVSLSGVSGTLTGAQLEAGPYPTSFIPDAGGVRAADVVWFDNPLAGEENLVRYSRDVGNAGYWPSGGVDVTRDQPDSAGGREAILVVSTTGGHRYAQADLQVTPGAQYTWSFEAKNNGGTAAALSVYCVSTGQDIISASAGSYLAEINGSTWTRVHRTFTVPQDCSSINVYLLRDSGDGVNLYLVRPQLEQGSAFTSYAPTVNAPAATDVSGGSWCVRGTWTPEKGAPWMGPSRPTHYRVVSTLEYDTPNTFFLSYAWSAVLTWDVFGADNYSHRLVPSSTLWAAGSTHTLVGTYDTGAISLYEDGVSVGLPTYDGDGVMSGQNKRMGLTPFPNEIARPYPNTAEPFGGILEDFVVGRGTTPSCP